MHLANQSILKVNHVVLFRIMRSLKETKNGRQYIAMSDGGMLAGRRAVNLTMSNYQIAIKSKV